MSRRWKEIKEDPAKLSEYNDRARQMQNDDSQNEKTPTAKHLKRVPKTPEFVDTDSDDTDDEQGPAAKRPQKASKTSGYSDDEQEPAAKQPKNTPKTSEIVDTDSDDTDDEQGPTAKQPQKASKIPGYSDDEQEPTVKCIVMYITEGEQEPVVKQPQKALKIPKFVDTGTEDEQEPTVKQPQKANEDPQETSPASVKPAKIPNFAAASCTYILTKGVRKQTNKHDQPNSALRPLYPLHQPHNNESCDKNNYGPYMLSSKSNGLSKKT